MHFWWHAALYTGNIFSGALKIHAKKFRSHTLHEFGLYASTDNKLFDTIAVDQWGSSSLHSYRHNKISDWMKWKASKVVSIKGGGGRGGGEIPIFISYQVLLKSHICTI